MKKRCGDFKKPKRKPGENVKKCYRITCKDNGGGIRDKEISMLGTFYCTSKSIRQQSRGSFGIGVKMPFIYSYESTCCPIIIRSATRNKGISEYHLTLQRDQTLVLKPKGVTANENGWFGTEIMMSTLGFWKEKVQMITQYLELIPLVNPNIEIDFKFISIKGATVTKKYNIDGPWKRLYEDKLALLDPCSISRANLQKIKECSQQKTLESFLKNDFRPINNDALSNMIKKMKLEFGPETELTRITKDQLFSLHKILESSAPSDKISSEGLSLVGEYFTSSIKEYLSATVSDGIFVSTLSRRINACKGHPFVVEALITIGGGARNMKKGLNIYRFANRAPLVLEVDADLITKVAKNDINWKAYNIMLEKEHVGIFVSIVGTKMPFNSLLKEYLCNSNVIEDSVKSALIECCENLMKDNALIQHKEDVAICRSVNILENFVAAEFAGRNIREDLKVAIREDLAKRQAMQKKPKINRSSAAKKSTIQTDDGKVVTERTNKSICFASFQVFDPTEIFAAHDIIINDEDVRTNFTIGNYIEKDIVLFFCQSLFHDDKKGKTKFVGGPRAFLHTELTGFLVSSEEEWNDEKTNQHVLASKYIKHYLGDICKANLIFIPVLVGEHWTVHCLNIKKNTIDVFDSALNKDHKFAPRLLSRLEEQLKACWAEKQSTMSEDELSNCWKEVPTFSGWNKHYVAKKCQSKPDCAILCMKFMEYWNGEILNPEIDPDKGDEYRQEYLNYMVHHETNMIREEEAMQKQAKGDRSSAAKNTVQTDAGEVATKKCTVQTDAEEVVTHKNLLALMKDALDCGYTFDEAKDAFLVTDKDLHMLKKNLLDAGYTFDVAKDPLSQEFTSTEQSEPRRDAVTGSTDAQTSPESAPPEHKAAAEVSDPEPGAPADHS